MYREGAFGDHIHMSNVIKAFDEAGWEITFMYNWKGAQVHEHNPRIDHRIFHESGGKNWNVETKRALGKTLVEAYKKYDRFINFQQSLEHALVEPESRSSYFWPLSWRRRKNSDTCFYDQSMRWAGLTGKKYRGWTGEIYFTAQEHEHVKAWCRKYIGDRHFVLWALRGSMYQKAVYPLAKTLCDEWLKRHPDSVIVTTGDKFCQRLEWEHPNVIHKSGRMPFRQAMHLAGYADMVVTPETGLGIAAGAYSTPKVMLMTAASLTNIVGNDQNDYSIQSPAYCSPCHRAIYNTDNCPRGCYGINELADLHREPLPLCVDFDPGQVLEQMEKAYADHGRYNEHRRNAPMPGDSVYM